MMKKLGIVLMMTLAALVMQMTAVNADCCTGLYQVTYTEPAATNTYYSVIGTRTPVTAEFKNAYVVETQKVVQTTTTVPTTYVAPYVTYDYWNYPHYTYDAHVRHPTTNADHLTLFTDNLAKTVNQCTYTSYYLTVRNSGPIDEDNVRFSVTINGVTASSGYFTVAKGSEKSDIVNIQVPCTGGSFPVTIRVASPYHNVEYVTWVYVNSAKVISQGLVPYWYNYNTVPVTAVPVVTQAQQPAVQAQPVNNYITVVVSSDGVQTSADGTTRVVVKDGKVSVEASEKKKISDAPQPSLLSGKVDVSASQKEIDISKAKGNLLQVTISNNGNKDSLFEIKSDFANGEVFLPESMVLKKGTSATMAVYFTPSENTGRKEGNLYVVQDNAVLKTLPVTLYSAPQQNMQTVATPARSFASVPNTAMIVGAAALIAVILLALYGGNLYKGKKTPRNPLMPLHQRLRDEVYRIEKVPAYLKDTYNTNWDQVIE